ncbi:hypothetical protein T03_3639 [Trichinella britovi]|uniref:Uncharacterized protein n=1 Tax=Trichinella britovi TaxID=45882 RepID=A0A0V1CEW0_TRIBR|nr:hypothetical protein T03_3639 [Trichinella britovi]
MLFGDELKCEEIQLEDSILNIKKAIAVFQLHAFETIVILSLVAMETAAIFPYSLQTDQQ